MEPATTRKEQVTFRFKSIYLVYDENLIKQFLSLLFDCCYLAFQAALVSIPGRVTLSYPWRLAKV